MSITAAYDKTLFYNEASKYCITGSTVKDHYIEAAQIKSGPFTL